MGKKGLDKVADPSLALAMAATSYRELEGLKRVGEHELLRIPKELKLDSPDLQAVYAKLGRPEKGVVGAGGYELPEIEGVDPADDMRPHFAQWAHEAGLNTPQAKLIVERFVAFSKQFAEKQAEAFALDEAEAMPKLRRQWGGAADAKMQAAHTGQLALQKSIGLSADDIDNLARSIGSEKALRILSAYGESIGEHRPADGGGGSGGGRFNGAMTPDQAKAAREAKLSDPNFVRVWKDARQPGHEAAVQEIYRLRQIEHGGTGREANAASGWR